jgi:hypothetical protein
MRTFENECLRIVCTEMDEGNVVDVNLGVIDII